MKWLSLLLGFVLRKTLKLSFKLAIRPYALISVVMVGMVACSGSDDYSPYGGSGRSTGIKIGKPYTIRGITYYPRYDKHYNERGIASWYGPGFHGRMTASGERYDQEDITAAHKTLPLPSIVKVTRTDTGESLLVRVNDRGPFEEGRIIDLSKGAARKLNLLGAGVAPVKVTYLEDETKTYLASLDIPIPDYMGGNGRNTRSEYASRVPKRNIVIADNQDASLQQEIELASYSPVVDVELPYGNLPFAYQDESREVYQPQRTSASSLRLDPVKQQQVKPETARAKQPKPIKAWKADDASFRVQTASFSSYENASRHVQELATLSEAHIEPVDVKGAMRYRVTLSPVKAYPEAISLLRKTQEMGYKDARIMVE